MGVAGACVMGWYGANRFLPVQHLPWRALNPDAPIGRATKAQLLRLSLAPSEKCMALTDDIPALISKPSQAHRPNGACGWDIARDVSHSAGAQLTPNSAHMQCPLAVASYLWSRRLNQIALEEMGSSVTSLVHFGTYSCRRQRGNGSGQWSEHAFANAWDIAAFELKDGRVISVKSGWNGGPSERKFLRRARDAACSVFNVTLSPAYNAAHADHFHFDMGPSRTCR